jgi:hypothetical protein
MERRCAGIPRDVQDLALASVDRDIDLRASYAQEASRHSQTAQSGWLRIVVAQSEPAAIEDDAVMAAEVRQWNDPVYRLVGSSSCLLVNVECEGSRTHHLLLGDGDWLAAQRQQTALRGAVVQELTYGNRTWHAPPDVVEYRRTYWLRA